MKKILCFIIGHRWIFVLDTESFDFISSCEKCKRCGKLKNFKTYRPGIY